jgi:N utilization substance protein B
LDEQRSLKEDGRAFATELVTGVLREKRRLDESIAAVAPNWPIEQLAIVDRNILRLALYELYELKTPLKAAINEAVELAKIYGSDNSSRFVNGVLGAIAAQIQEHRYPWPGRVLRRKDGYRTRTTSEDRRGTARRGAGTGRAERLFR